MDHVYGYIVPPSERNNPTSWLLVVDAGYGQVQIPITLSQVDELKESGFEINTSY